MESRLQHSIERLRELFDRAIEQVSLSQKESDQDRLDDLRRQMCIVSRAAELDKQSGIDVVDAASVLHEMIEVVIFDD